ncbi:MAG: FAD:protein FMN transferase [Mycobacteriales bacterium]
MHRIEHVMGTVVSITVVDTGFPTEALDAAFGWLRWVDTTFTTYDEGSVVSRLGRGELTVADCPPEVAEVLALGEALEARTDGYFSCYPAGRLDPSGLVKGWSVEQASALLGQAGAANHCINAGGDLRTAGEPAPGRPWRVGVAHPLRRDALVDVVSGRALAVATSGSAERGAHVLDPHTGRAPVGLASLTVVGSDLTLVDAYATAGFARGVSGLDWLATVDGMEGLAVSADGVVTRSAGFPAGADLPVARKVG